MTFRIREAFDYAKSCGRTVKKKDLSVLLWEKSSTATARANFTNLQSGRVRKLEAEKIIIICNYLGVTADYLLGLSDSPTRYEEKEQINDCLDTIGEKVTEIRNKI